MYIAENLISLQTINSKSTDLGGFNWDLVIPDMLHAGLYYVLSRSAECHKLIPLPDNPQGLQAQSSLAKHSAGREPYSALKGKDMYDV